MFASAGRIGATTQRQILAILTMTLLTGWTHAASALAAQGLGSLAANAVGWTQPKLVYLTPGTPVTNKPPTGWSHLVLKSLPRLASGDRGTLPAGASKMATMFRTVILANVLPVDTEEKDFVLQQVGLAICVPQDDDHDIVVAGNRLDAIGLKLSMMQRAVLDAAEAELAESRIIARTSTFALLKAPTTLLEAGRHRHVDIYYAFCVERTTGKLRVGVWTMPEKPDPKEVPGLVVRLTSNPVYTCEIDVHARRILGTVPYSWSFAMRSLPPGLSLEVPAELAHQIATTARKPTAENAEELERLMLDTLCNAAPDKVEKVGYRTTAPPK